MRLVAGLACADAWHDRGLFLCLVLAVTAMTAPLLLLLGLKTAVIDHLLTRLRDDPANREILHQGNRRFAAEWFETIRARPDVAFVAPRTREISRQIDVARPAGAARGFDAEMVVSGPKDPRLGALAERIGPDTAVITERLARAGGFAAGDTILLWTLRRGTDGQRRADIHLRLAGIAPDAAHRRAAVFVTPPIAAALEDFSDGLAVPARGWAGNPPPGARDYASFRLFARDITDVAGLEKFLLDEGYNVASNGTMIDWTLTLDRQLNRLFALIAVCAGGGAAVALGASLWANVTRKRRDLSLLRMMGVRQAAMPLFPLTQAALVALAGGAAADAVAHGVAAALNAAYGGVWLQGAPICAIGWRQTMGVAGVTLVTALLAGAAAAVFVLRIAPAEGMRGA